MSHFVTRLKRAATTTTIRRNIGMTLARQIFAALTQLLVVILIARELGPEGNGLYAMAILVPTLLANFLNFGVGPATVYFLGRKEVSLKQALIGNTKLGFILVLVGTVIMVPVLLLWGEIVFPGVPRSLLLIGLAGYPIVLLLAFLCTILQGLEDFRAFNTAVLFPPIITLLAVILSLHILELGVVGALVSFVSGQLVGLIAVIFHLRRHLRKSSGSPGSGPSMPPHSYERKVLGYGWKAHLSNVVTFVNYRADIFLVNFFLSPATTGVYVIAVQIAEKLWMPSQAVSTVLYPRLSAMSDDPKARLRLANRGAFLVAILTGFISVIAVLGLYWIIGPVFGEEYNQALPAFLWLMPGVVFWAGARVQANCIAAAGKPEWNMYTSFFVVAINVIGNILLIPRFGIVGAAWATSLSYIFDAVIKFFLVYKTVNAQE